MNHKEKILQFILDFIQLSESSYEKALDRYKSIIDFLKESELSQYDLYLFSQGSFRLGTAIKPISQKEEYDLDLTCVFIKNFNPENFTQKDLKETLGNELENYRQINGIKDLLEEKKRCWRLNYADKSPSFHLDITPGIPSSEERKEILFSKLNHSYLDSLGNFSLSNLIRDSQIWITDKTHPYYRRITKDWPISDPDGYAQWFLTINRSPGQKIDLSVKRNPVPSYNASNRTCLQKSIQILKRHRDVMFKDKNTDFKPISIIITTLSAYYYNPTYSLSQALEGIIKGLERFVEEDEDVVPNPVNPEENFADKWSSNPKLKKCFHEWVFKLKGDIASLEILNKEMIDEIFFVQIPIDLINPPEPKNLTKKEDKKPWAK